MLYLRYAKIYFKAFKIIKGVCIVFVCVLICTTENALWAPGASCALASGCVGSGDRPHLHLCSFSITSELCDLGQVTCWCVCVYARVRAFVNFVRRKAGTEKQAHIRESLNSNIKVVFPHLHMFPQSTLFIIIF